MPAGCCRGGVLQVDRYPLVERDAGLVQGGLVHLQLETHLRRHGFQDGAQGLLLDGEVIGLPAGWRTWCGLGLGSFAARAGESPAVFRPSVTQTRRRRP